ncbi:cyclic nucleotide-binding domain-containing protein [Candidatus Riflebacteria bacterium]
MADSSDKMGIMTQSIVSKSIFSKMDDTAMDKFFSLCDKRDAKAGSVIYSQNDHPHAFYIIKAGEIIVTQSYPDGSEKVLFELKDGDFFGEKELVMKSRRRVNIKAKSNCKFIVVAEENFNEILNYNPILANRILSKMGRWPDSAPELEIEHENTEAAPQVKKGKIICFYGPKGGVGCTTLALNTAFMLAKEFKKDVAMVDLDLQMGDVEFSLNIKHQDHKSLALYQDISLDDWDTQEQTEQLREIYIKNDELPFTVIAPPTNLEVSDHFLYSEDGSQKLLNIIDILQSEFDYVVIDCFSLLNSLVGELFYKSFQIFLVINPTIVMLKNGMGIMSIFKQSFEEEPEKLAQFKVISNENIVLKEPFDEEALTGQFDNFLLSVPPSESCEIALSQAGKLACEIEAECPFTEAIKGICSEVTGEAEKFTKKEKSWKSLILGKLFG